MELNGKADGVNLDKAIVTAIEKAPPPSPGFDVQTFIVKEHYLIKGGFTNMTETHVIIKVIDGFKEEKMQNDLQPRFDNLHDNPMRADGLSEKEIKELEKQGWEVRVLKGDRHNTPVAFASNETPFGFAIKYGTIPDGTKVIENDGLGQSIILGCGNPCPILNKDYTVP